MSVPGQELYYEAYEAFDGGWYWKIYHYDESGNDEVVLHFARGGYSTQEEAEDACADYMEDHGIEATLSG